MARDGRRAGSQGSGSGRGASEEGTAGKATRDRLCLASMAAGGTLQAKAEGKPGLSFGDKLIVIR